MRGIPSTEFHVPSALALSEDFMYLVGLSRDMTPRLEVLQDVSNRFASMGYGRGSNGNEMVKDYILFVLRDLLDKHQEVYLTRQDVLANASILQLFSGFACDLLVKTNKNREKPVAVCICQSPAQVLRSAPALGTVATLLLVHPASLMLDQTAKQPNSQTGLLPEDDLKYMHRHFELFIVGHVWWRSLLSLNNSMQRAEPALHSIIEAARDPQAAAQFAVDMSLYADSVLDRSNI